MKPIVIPRHKDVPEESISMQAWDTEDFCNSAYNQAINDMTELLEKQGLEFKHED